MSWWWSSSKPKAAPVPPDTLADPNPEVQPTTTTAQVPVSQKLSREEQATQEFNELLRELQEQADSEKDARVQARESGKSGAPPIPADISPESVYPTEMSCRSALDYAMFCQSFGGQFVNVYRYGEFRSCSNHWQDFWLCMRTRSLEPKEKAKAIQDHYKNKAIKWKRGPSSEDVWDVRDEPVKDAFQDNLEELESRIVEWKKSNPGVPDPWLRQQGATFSNPPSGAQ